MTREEVLELMQTAGFSIEWTEYQNLQDTVAKFARFAGLIEAKVRALPTETGGRRAAN